MHIEFTIGLGFIEFLCHFVAAFFYGTAGYGISKDDNEHTVILCYIIAIVLNTMGAHL